MTNNRRAFTATINDLPYEILIQIFLSLSMLDIITGVSGVSRAWREVCSDSKLWKIINIDAMLKTSEWFINRKKPLELENNRNGIDIQLPILKNALKLSRGNVDCLVFHSITFLTNEHLLYAAKRSLKLKQLVLPAWNQINMIGLEKAIVNWKDLESLTIPCFYNSCKLMRIIGAHCNKFCVLKIRCPVDIEFAKAIVEHVPGLKVLSIRYTVFHKDALLYLLKNLKDLEVLDLSHSRTEICIIPNYIDAVELRALVGPAEVDDNEIIENVSKLKRLIACQDILLGRSCTCALNYVDIKKWNESDDKPSFA